MKKRGKEPYVWIIIVNWNGLEDTLECINSIKLNSYKNYQICVIDNDSKNHEAEKLIKKNPEIKIIKNDKNLGFTGANNQGIELAMENNADYIFILNNDTIIDPSTISELVAYASSKKFKGILQPKILYYKSDLVWSMGGKFNMLISTPRLIGQGKNSSDYQDILSPEFALGCAMFINAEVIEDVGGFDDDYFANYEDIDLSWRIMNSGYNILVLPESIIHHKVSQSSSIENKFKLDPFQSYLYARNGLLFGFKNFHGVKLIWYVISQLMIKMPGYLIFKCANLRSRKEYLRGVKEGIKFNE